MYAQDKNRFGSKQTQLKYGSQLAGFKHIELRLRHAKLGLARYPHICVQNHDCPKVGELFSSLQFTSMTAASAQGGFPISKASFSAFPTSF